MQNVVGDGVCGENGNFEIVEQFGVSSYEKDGAIRIIWQSGGAGPGSVSGPPLAETSVQAVNDDSVFWHIEIPGFFQAAETFTFTGIDRDVLMGVASGTDLQHEYGDERFQQIVSSSLAPRTGRDDFLKAVRAAFEEHKVKEVPGWAVDGEALPECLALPGGQCPNENDWCKAGKDPSCTTSTYQEPAASLNGQGIALVVLCTAIALTGAFLVLHRKLAKMQSDRIKSHFAGQVARRINHRGSISQLNPEALAEEFERMTSKDNGQVGKVRLRCATCVPKRILLETQNSFLLFENVNRREKEELWNFVSSGKAGDMSKNDFEALFEVMDVNNDGSVSFVEFCAFMVS